MLMTAKWVRESVRRRRLRELELPFDECGEGESQELNALNKR
jgi:hypothetical protein